MLEFISDTTNRLDKFIASQVDVSRAKVQKAIKDGKVMVDGVIVLDSDYNVIVGNKVTLPEFEPEALKPSDVVLKIVFENDDLAVIDKPAGMVVHPGAGNLDDTLANALLRYFPGIEKVGEPHRPGIVHRLDEDTSGLILIAKTTTAYEYFKKLFMERKVEKEYLALVHKVPKNKHGTINAPLEKVPLKQKMKVGSGKEAVTEYWVLKEGKISGLDQVALLRVKLHTGRTHQIRAHLAHIDHPIVGDEVYGSMYKQQDLKVINRQFLHAYRLKFQLLDGTFLELGSKLPIELKQVLTKASIKYVG
jgi:23S rRNA pseudouridine1911/1915/1917 synthase